MDVIDPTFHLYAFEDPNSEPVLEHLEKLKKVYQALEDGRLYLRFIAGDRKGSLAKCSHNGRYRKQSPPTIEPRRTFSFNEKIMYEFQNNRFYVVCTWKGRRNQVQINFPNDEVECLIGDDIETVYEVFDAKAAKAEILKAPNQTDIDGNVLAVGDRVMFINISYGSRMYLQRGTITEFKAVVNTSSTKITTIIHNDEGVKSELHYPHDMVSKIS